MDSQVAAAFAMMFSSSLSVMELYFLKRFPIPYALYLTGVSIIAGFFGQYFVWKLVAAVGRASIIIFILSSVIFASALTMGYGQVIIDHPGENNGSFELSHLLNESSLSS
ncbi:hypothetical protein EJ110_NYTH13015 [Nymphaea thermarum]|nr:hypothetical protein EJ110_NYTH13015 [Nymphaea thermarum]